MRSNRGTLDRNGLPTPNIANAPPYLVAEILSAYNAKALGVTGAGQTIAILIDTLSDDSDLVDFWNANGIELDLTRIGKVKAGIGHLPAREGEETLDVSWTSGIAPGAKIKIYATGSLPFGALDQALDRIIADASNDLSLRQLSISLGLGETFLGGPNGEVAAQHQNSLGSRQWVSTSLYRAKMPDPIQTATGTLPTTLFRRSMQPRIRQSSGWAGQV